MLIVSKKYESFDKVLEATETDEATLKGTGSGNDYTKHDFKYALAVIDQLLSGGELRLGEKGEKGVVSGANLKSANNKALKKLRDNIATSTVDDFNDAMAGTGVKWNHIFKGDVSGYSNGLASKNKGNAFEDYFVNNFDVFEPEIKKIAKYKKRTGEPRSDGGLNQKRPLTFSGGKITCGPAGNYNIGKTVTDVTVPVEKCKAAPNGELYLSLKSGDTVTFVNAGIKKLFTDGFFDGSEKLRPECKALLDMLGIDEEKFKNVFNSYTGRPDGKKTRSEKEIVDVTSKLKNNPVFNEFVKSVIGYGFLMVHQNNGNDVDYIDFLSEDKLNDFASDVESAEIRYPVGGKDKRVDLVVKYPKIMFKFNIRSKDGGVLPTHLMADYKFL